MDGSLVLDTIGWISIYYSGSFAWSSSSGFSMCQFNINTLEEVEKYHLIHFRCRDDHG